MKELREAKGLTHKALAAHINFTLRKSIEDMLREQGISDERIAAIRTPVGLDLGGRTPAEIALSVMAQITKERYGH